MRFIICLLLASTLGCSPAQEDEAIPSTPRLGPPPSAPVWLAFDTLERPVRFDPLTGVVLATGPVLEGVDRDLAFDPWTGRVAVFASPEGDGGTVHLLSPELVPDEGGFPIDGRVEMRFEAEGLWLFEESYGQRWRRIRRDGEWEPSWGLPAPSSLWSVGDSGFGAIVDDAGTTMWLGVDPLASTIPATATPFAGIVPTSGAVRAAPLPDGVALAWTVKGGILVCVVDGAGALVHERVLPRSETVRQAAVLATSRGPWLALALVDESDPSLPATVVAVDPYTEAITPEILLPGNLLPDLRVDRRMIAETDRLIVATSAGLQALILTLDPPQLSSDPAFSGALLRGPLERRPATIFQTGDLSAL